MEYDKIIDKIIKLKELVDRGLDGEASNGKHVLENLCKLHNVNIEDLFKEEKSDMYLKSNTIISLINNYCFNVMLKLQITKRYLILQVNQDLI